MTGLWSIIICSLAGLVISSTLTDSTVQCESRQLRDNLKVIQGEALYWPCPNVVCSTKNKTDSMFYWFKNSTDGTQQITTEESARVHHHGPVLYILPLTLNDTGHYITRWLWKRENGTVCNDYETFIMVYEAFNIHIYSNQSEQPPNVRITCLLCEYVQKTLSWYKDFHLIPGESEEHLLIYNFLEKDEGIYTCLCTWEHNGRKYNTSQSRHVQLEDTRTSFHTKINYPHNNSVVLVDLGSEVKLKCSVFFGINMKECSVSWFRNETELAGVKGYTIRNMETAEEFQSLLTISEVSEVDLQSEFRCQAMSAIDWVEVFVTLKPRVSVFPLVMTYLCAFLVFLLIVGSIKWFAVDLALFFRSFQRNNRNDGKVYDACVIYQKDNMNEETEKSVAHFINRVLPTILEKGYGFKLYIHGRDDLPGEDSMELTETIMQLSRRLIVVLTEPQVSTTPPGYDWQVGLYQVLVQQEMSIILIQLGDMKDYSYLPLGLQHLLQKTPPLKWHERSRKASSPSSRFWKQVRYMMPVPEHQPCISSRSPLPTIL